jgi:hypothetical protein
MASVQKSERTAPYEGFVSGGLVTGLRGQPRNDQGKETDERLEANHTLRWF